MVDLGMITLDRDADAPLHRQLVDALRDAILSGRVKAGSKLPPSRELSRTLDVSRTVVVGAYEQLETEGYVDGRVGAGTYVAEALAQPVPESVCEPDVSFSERGERLVGAGRAMLAVSEPAAPFRPGVPALDAFPFQRWARILAREARDTESAAWGYGDAVGHRPLREAIAIYLAGSRGVRCTADQVVIVTGTQQALDLCARLLIDTGDSVWCENPCYRGASGVFHGAGAHVEAIPLDAEGLDVNAAVARAPKARMAYVTPSHQYPLGVTMPIARRLQLLEWAAGRDAWILEDDYDSEFRYEGQPIPSMQGLDEAGRVLYMGTFSKVMFPGLRLGYLVVPPGLAAPFAAVRALNDRCPPVAPQRALTTFLRDSHFARHVRRMRRLYRARQEAFVGACRAELAGLLHVDPSPAGLHLVGYLPEGVDDAEASVRAERCGIVAPPLSEYYLTPEGRSGLLLGYAGVPESRMPGAVKQLRRALC